MEDYPAGSLDHNIPLVFVSGLTTGSTRPLLTDPALREQSILIRSELAPLESREAATIFRRIQEADASNWPWNAQDVSKKPRLKIEAIGRDILLPPRNARLPEDVEATPTPPILHSPFSPLSPGSTLYPDGLIDCRWLEKHQSLIPSVCLYFYNLTSDPTLATLHDNQLKTDINAVKNALAQSGHKCRLAVVLVSDQAPASMQVFQERLENIRWGAGLDPKTSLFVLPTKRPVADLESAVDSILSSVSTQAAEYYRDLGRRSRKKKGRGITPQPTVPPTSGTSHTLSLQGWSVRYDFKAGVFAEFRQDMDSALRSYEQAYESLLGPDVLETVPSWSQRFNDGRLLADVLAVRIIRCHLWNGYSTAAVRRWHAHRLRIADFLDRRGKGTNNYGWFAWEARWAEIMAQSIAKVGYTDFEPSSSSLFRPPEKPLSAERLQPWELLHHPGYWYRIAAGHALDRRKMALAISEDDRKVPDVSIASMSAARTYNSYDTYMCPEPYEEFPDGRDGHHLPQLILRYLKTARVEFQKRQQIRLATEVAMLAAKELEQAQLWKQSLELLTPLWRDMKFRKESWWDITETLSWTVRKAAAEAGHADLVVAIDWELISSNFSRRHDWDYDLTKSLRDIKVERKPEVTLSGDRVSSFLSSSFVFKRDEGRAGQTCPAQLAITSNAVPGSQPVVLDEIRVRFEGSIRELQIQHEARPAVEVGAKKVFVTSHVLSETDGSSDFDAEQASETDQQQYSSVILQGHDDLTLYPGQSRIFEFHIPLREAGEAQASTISVTFNPSTYKLIYDMQVRESNSAGSWYSTAGRKKAVRTNAHSIKVLPRPPKMEIKFVDLLKQYYCGETIRVGVDILNEEDVDANIKLDMQLYGQSIPSFQAHIGDSVQQSSTQGGEEAKLNGLNIGTIATSKHMRGFITIDPNSFQTTYELTLKAVYHLVSDPGTPIVQVVSLQIKVVSPFEASCDLVPRLHHDAWPSIFDPENIQDTADDGESAHHAAGLAQKWCLMTRYASFATEDVRIVDLDVEVVGTQGSITCTTAKNQAIPPEGLIVATRVMEKASFDVFAQKLSLDDRGPSTAELKFIIKWVRVSSTEGGAASPNTTAFLLDPFYVTVSEPRVLGAVSYSQTSGPRISAQSPEPTPQPAETLPLVILDITIENPSNHFLTFGLTMEPSDDFAYSGAKTTTLNVLPIARRTVTYRLLPMMESTETAEEGEDDGAEEGGRWMRVSLVVRDKYFQKVLRIVPVEGMRREGEGVSVWVPRGVVAVEQQGSQ